MNIDEAMDFLRQHQPMPATDLVSDELASRYDKALDCLSGAGEPSCIPMLLNSFGDGDLFGVYTRVEGVICQFDEIEVVDHLNAALASRSDSVKYWSLQIASNFPNEILIPNLLRLARSNSLDIRTAAITTMGSIPSKEIDSFLLSARDTESDEDLNEILADIIECRGL